MAIRIEVFRFGVYIVLPIAATAMFSDPSVMHKIVTQVSAS